MAYSSRYLAPEGGCSAGKTSVGKTNRLLERRRKITLKDCLSILSGHSICPETGLSIYYQHRTKSGTSDGHHKREQIFYEYHCVPWRHEQECDGNGNNAVFCVGVFDIAE